MEEVHGVDVSWLHHQGKEPSKHRRAPSSNTAATDLAQLPQQRNSQPPTANPVPPKLDTAQAKSSPARTAKSQTATTSPTQPITSPPSNKAAPTKRPGVGSRTNSSEETRTPGSRRQSWMNSLSSKFSSSTPEKPSGTQNTPNGTSNAPTKPAQANGVSPAGPTANGAAPQPTNTNSSASAPESAEPYTPAKPRDSSFFSSLTRRLSSATQSGGPPKNIPRSGAGGLCERRILNVDPNRARCLVPDMDASRLRRVSFCVDVEVAGGPRYSEEEGDDDDDDGDEESRRKKKTEAKMKERAEGEALKHPELLKEEKEEEGEPKLEQKSKAVAVPTSAAAVNGTGEKKGASPPKGSLDDEASLRKKEKKKKSEEERKERKEKRKRRAEENGQIPLELSLDDSDDDATATDEAAAAYALQQKRFPVPMPGAVPLPPATARTQPQQPHAPPRPGRATTDPVRIYRRCCQLRESPILKRITEQLMAPTCCLPQEPGVVDCLDLTGSRLQVADFATLGDWLAVVPVKKLILEDADLNDEGVRCVLAGLLAAKKPEPGRRRNSTLRYGGRSARATQHQERAGQVEKLTLKNNPRISRNGWKHISLFVYMCRSLKAIDLSMNQFPEKFPPSHRQTTVKNAQNGAQPVRSEIDAAETLYRCLAERLGGSHLEELILSECGLSAPQIRKVVDGAIMCGITRLGLAGNHLDDTGLDHVMIYLRSGICHGLDIGGNDLRGKLDIVAAALQKRPDIPCWGLSFADCNLDSASLKPLFPALQGLTNFRFIDLSHNRDLFRDNTTVSLLRRHMGQLKELKRIHLADCGISPKQAIALADALADAPRLAHLSLLQNPQLTALANAKTEALQEEACALYASLMAAVRVSSTLICIDIDVPSQDNSEVVIALAKQVVAYCLRNMEQFAIAEATGAAIPTANATTALTSAYGGEQGVKEFVVPDVLMQLVGHIDGAAGNHDNDDPAPDDDYIVGGTGVVKALQYVLGEKANDHRNSLGGTPTPRSGSSTPTHRPSSGGMAASSAEQRGKAKKMSTDLLESARKIRDRLQPALAKEASQGDELAYRRLLFLDQTLQSMIARFEEEFPETRPAGAAAPANAANDTTADGGIPPLSLADGESEAPASQTKANADEKALAASVTAAGAESDEDEESLFVRPSRRNSDVSLASRAQHVEEGHLHRIGQQLRREVIASPRTSVAEGATKSDALPSRPAGNGLAPVATPPTQIADQVSSAAASLARDATPDAHDEEERERIRRLGERVEAISGTELKNLVVGSSSYDAFLRNFGTTYEDLRRLQEEDPEGWEQFKESQAKARLNIGRDFGEVGDAGHGA